MARKWPWDDRSKWLPSIRQLRDGLTSFGITRDQSQIISVALDTKLAGGSKTRINEVLAELPDVEPLMRTHGVVHVSTMANVLEIPDLEYVMDSNDQYIYESASAMLDGEPRIDEESGDLSDEYLKAEESVRDELSDQWRSAICDVVANQLRKMGGDLVFAFGGKELRFYMKVAPEEGWPAMQMRMVDAMNGVDQRYYGFSDKEILDGLTNKEWVIKHWIAAVEMWSRAYDGTTIKRLYERAWR